MRLARLTPAMAVVFAFSILAACGGGSSGGSNPPTVAPSSPGGGAPPPATGTPSPTPKPSPTGSATPGHTPTPTPTASATTKPTPTPTPKPTPSPTPKPTPTPTPTPTPKPSSTPSKITRGAGNGQINGDDTMFPGGVGEEPNDGDYPNGGHGPVNTSIGPDNVPCLSAMYGGPHPPGYHVHAFVGIYYNGTEAALPDGLGFADPSGDGTFNGISNWTQYAYNPSDHSKPGCYYEMHTHDASGIIHIESATAPSGDQRGTLYTLGDFLAIWGIQVNASQWGPLTGPVSIYTSGQLSRGDTKTSTTLSNTYTLWQGDPASIPLYSHEVIWVVVGSGNPTGSSLPNVHFFDTW